MLVYCCELVEVSLPDSLRFLAAFLSAPPRYLRPVRQAASCLAFTEYLVCICVCVVLPPNLHSILYATDAASSHVGLLIFSPCRFLDVGSGVMVISTLVAISSGRSIFFGVLILSSRPSSVFT